MYITFLPQEFVFQVAMRGVQNDEFLSLLQKLLSIENDTRKAAEVLYLIVLFLKKNRLL